MFHICYLVMSIRREVRASSLPKLLRALRPAFAIRDLSYWIEGREDHVDLSYMQPPEPGRSPLWRGEYIEEDAELTRYTPSDEEEFLTSFDQHLGDCQDSRFWMSVEGALRHRPPGADKPDWFGRWRISENSLYELFTIRITCTPGEPRDLEFLFPLIGYPLTAARPANSAIDGGDPRTAKLNRDELLPIIARARDAFGLAPDEARWWQDGEFDSDYPDDARELRECLTRMNAG